MNKGKAGAKKGRKSTGSNYAKAGQNTTATFPVVVTTYEMCMKDRQHLSGFQWKFIVVDEGHRLKNLDCKWVGMFTYLDSLLILVPRLIRELKSYSSANRMILTGTPLHVSMSCQSLEPSRADTKV